MRTVLADSGYVSKEKFARADAGGLRLLAPLAKDPAGTAPAPPASLGPWLTATLDPYGRKDKPQGPRNPPPARQPGGQPRQHAQKNEPAAGRSD